MNSSNHNQNLVKIEIRTTKPKLKDVIESYLIYYLSENAQEIFSDQNIRQNLQESSILIIKQHIVERKNEKLFIIGFKNVIIIINQKLNSSFHDFLLINQNLPIYIFRDTLEAFNNQIIIPNHKLIVDDTLENEISNFNLVINSIKQKSGHLIDEIRTSILPCMAGYLIRDSYIRQDNEQNDLLNRIQQFHNQPSNEEKNCNSINGLDTKDYIELRMLGIGSSSIVYLIYHIEQRKLFAIKKKNAGNDKNDTVERELKNYQTLRGYPLLPKFYGTTKDNHLIIEFINGLPLSDIENKEKGQKQIYQTRYQSINSLFITRCKSK